MFGKRKNKLNKTEADVNIPEQKFADPFSEDAFGGEFDVPGTGPGTGGAVTAQDAAATGKAAAAKRKRKGIFRKKKKSDEKALVRIEEIRKRAENGEYDDLGDEMVISTYIPHRRAKLIGAAILRLGRLRMFLLTALLIVCGLFILAFMQEKMGNFTINLDRLEFYRKGIAIAADGGFTSPTARLTAAPVQDATNITFTDLPEDIDTVDGEHNGLNYMAYTYYVRNAGKEDLDYTATVKLKSCSKGAEKAVRVAIWKNDELKVYAARSSDGEPEPDTEPFESDSIVCTYTEPEFLVGNVDKYTIVIWMEGEDPECIDNIVGGSVEFGMYIGSTARDDTSLFVKFVQDIVDTIRGNRPISASGVESPDYYKYQDVNYYNRRNQPGKQNTGSE
ncbi:MAG: hypothetical protein Q4D40_04415 [Eubacteriales bacterium]|nr:hypothetical protein [Eubacteriales bacterium]